MPFIKYDFAILGLNDVERAFATLERRAVEHNRRVMSSLGATGRTVGPGTLTAVAANRNAGNEAEKLAQQKVRAEEKAAAQIARIREREDKRWQDLAKKSADYRISQQLRAEREVEKSATRAAHEEERRQVRLEQRSRTLWSNSVRGMIHGTGRTVMGAIGAAGAFTGIGGAALFANATHEYMRTKASASGLANQMAGAGETATSINARKGNILSAMSGISGMRVADKIEAARAFGGISGNYALGLRLTKDLTNLSLATDVALPDLARVAGSAYMKLKTPGMSEADAATQTMEAIRTFAGQGNVGAVEIKDLALYGNRLTAGAAKFRGSRIENMASMGTLAQMAVGVGSAADAAEATMSAERFASDITEHSKNIEHLRVGGKAISPFTDKSKTQFREIPELLADIIQGTGGSMPKMKEIFGERSFKMAEAFQQTYLDAEREKKGSGRAAILGKFAEFRAATLSEGDVSERAKARLSDEDMILEQNMERLNMAIGKELAPALTALVNNIGEHKDQIVAFANAVEKAVEFFIKNPFEGLGIVVAGAIVKELAVAGLGNLIKGALLGGGMGAPGMLGAGTSAIIGGSGASAAAAAGGWAGVGGGLGILGAIAIGTATFEVTTAILNAAKVGDGTEGAKPATEATANVANRISELNARVMDPEERARQRIEIIDEEAARLKKAGEGQWGGASREIVAGKKDLSEERAVAQQQLQAAMALKDAAALIGQAAPGAPQRSELPGWWNSPDYDGR